jgi:hypothetical protein
MENWRGSIHIGQYVSGKARQARPAASHGSDHAGVVWRARRSVSHSVPIDSGSYF